MGEGEPAGGPARERSVSVAGVIIDGGGRALLVRRRDTGRWELPGGVLELGEPVLAGLAREVAEETGLAVRALRHTGTYHHLGAGVIALVFRCAIAGGRLRVGAETAAFGWVTPEQARAAMTEPFAVRVLDAYGGPGPAVRDHDGERVLPRAPDAPGPPSATPAGPCGDHGDAARS